LIKPYRESLGTPFEIYSDPTKDTYVSSHCPLQLSLPRLIGMTRMIKVALGMTLRTLDMGQHNPEYQKNGMISNIFSSIARAFKIGSIFTKKAGDQKQLGGEFVFVSESSIFRSSVLRIDKTD